MEITCKTKINLSNNFFFKGYRFISSSPSIIKDPDNHENFLVLNRCNHNLYHKMCNQLLTLDSSFNILKKEIVPYVFVNNVKPDGYEDIRLFIYENKIYYIGVFRENKQYKLVSDIFYKNKEFALNHITITFKTSFSIEKNWVFFNYKSKLAVIYKWFPLYICEINYDDNKLCLLEERKMPDLFKEFWGSTCGVIYDNLIWFIIHKNERKDYFHAFVVFDEEMNLKKYSDYFKYESSKIEFCYGFLIENDEFVIAYSTSDKTTNIAIYDYEYIKNNISWNIV